MSTKRAAKPQNTTAVHVVKEAAGTAYIAASEEKELRKEWKRAFGAQLGQRCKQARGEMDIAEAAALLGVHRNTIWNIERGESLPDAYELDLIAKTYKVTTSYLLSGHGAAQGNDEDFALVDMLDVRVSAGGGSMNGHADVIGRFAFKRAWLAGKGVTADSAKIIRARGDSMADRINDGDILLVNTGVKHLQQDGVYVIEIDGLDYVKLLQRDFASGGLQIISYNQAYKAQRLTAEQAGELRISGRVVWHGGEL